MKRTAATRSAQQLLGLEQTGIADADTWTAVEALSLQLAAHAPNPDRGTPPGTAYPGRAIAEGSAGQEVGHSSLYFSFACFKPSSKVKSFGPIVIWE